MVRITEQEPVVTDDMYTLTVSPPLPTVKYECEDDLESIQEELWQKREEKNLLVEPLAGTPAHKRWKCKMQALSLEIKDLEDRFSFYAGSNASSEALDASNSSMRDSQRFSLQRFSARFDKHARFLSCTSSGLASESWDYDQDEEARADICVPTHIANESVRCCGYLLGKQLGSGAFSSVRKGYFGCSFTSSEGVRLMVARLIAHEFPDDILFVHRIIAEFESYSELNKIIYEFMKGDHGKAGAEKSALKLTEKPAPNTKSRHNHDLQFKTELAVFKHVRSPHIIKCYALNPSFAYSENGDPEKDYYAMCLELCEHGNLFDLVYYNEPLGEKLTRTLFLQICRGVSAMHKKDFVHRDLKPQNIVIDSDFNLKICDFGSSWRMRGASMEQYSLGTRGFRAPEIVLKHPYSKKCDAFSCGVLLFVLLTKLMPEIEEATPKDKLYRYIATRDFAKFWKLLDKRVSGLSKEVKALLGRLLTYQPNERMGINDRTSSKGVTYPGVFSDPWCRGPVYTQKELKPIMQELYTKASLAKKKKKAAEEAAKEMDAQE